MIDKDAIKQRNEAAHAMVHALCRPKGSQGSREWVMSIPAQPEYDPDLVIAASLRDVGELLLHVERLEGIALKPVDVHIYEHPSWDMKLILAPDENSYDQARQNLSEGDDVTLLTVTRGTMTRLEFETLPEWDG